MMGQINELINLMEDIELDLPKDFPNISTPVQKKDLSILYTYFNKKYFKNSLPKVRLKFAPLAKKFFGKAHIKWEGTEIKDLLITIADLIRGAKNEVVNTLLHEMIHIWQYMMFSKTGDKTYLDDFYSSLDRREHNLKGHGETFHKWANKFNAQGYKIDVSSGLPAEIKLIKEVYCIAFDMKGDESIFFFSTTDPEKSIESIITQVERRMGADFYTGYIIFKSKDSSVVQGIRLTKELRLPKNSVYLKFRKDWVESMIASPLSSGHKRVKSELSDKKVSNATAIPSSVVQTLQAVHKFRGYDFMTYLKTVIYNSEDFVHLKKIPGHKITGIPDPENGITAEIIAYIRQDWAEITDIEIKRNKAFKYSLMDVKGIISGREKASDIVAEIIKIYEDKFKDRVDIKRFKKLWFAFLISGFKKEAKKNSKYDEYTDEKRLSELFKGTLLESKKAEGLLIQLGDI